MDQCHGTEVIGQEVLPTIAFVGNPNVGKSALFGKVTGKYVSVSNFPGTTVEISRADVNGKRFIDTPGANSLVPFSEDEAIARNSLLVEGFESAVVVCDTKNLARGLSLLSQAAEFAAKCIFVLNMWDEAEQRGIRIKTAALSKRLGIPVLATVATEGRGIAAVRNTLPFAATATIDLKYPDNVEEAVEKIRGVVSKSGAPHNGTRGVAIALLSKDRTILKVISGTLTPGALQEIDEVIADCSVTLGGNVRAIIEECRTTWAQTVAANFIEQEVKITQRRREKSGLFLTHPVIGMIPAFGVLFLMWAFVGQFAAGTAVDYLENSVFGEFYIPRLADWLKGLLGDGFFWRVLVGDYGIISMGLTYALAIILPIVTGFFLFFGILEDSGYLPRLAVLLNNLCKKIGLNGKAVLPMVLGLGCDTMAVVTTRVLETKRERIIVSALLTMAIPCSAKLGILLVMAGGFGNEPMWHAAFRSGIWLCSLIFTVWLVGFIASRFLKGAPSDLILDVPPMRWPSLKNIWWKTYARLKWYTLEAVPLFIIGTLVLFGLAESGLLAYIRAGGEPVVQFWLGLPEKATDSIIMGFFRRDYGAAGFETMFSAGELSGIQVVTSLITITFLVPCIAQILVLKKEMGAKIAFGMAAASIVYALLLGGIVSHALRISGVSL